jgi:hypothetical protein
MYNRPFAAGLSSPRSLARASLANSPTVSSGVFARLMGLVRGLWADYLQLAQQRHTLGKSAARSFE